MEVLGAYQRIERIARGVLLRRSHEALGIDAIVEAPVGGRSDRHASLEDRTALAHAHQGAEATIAPSPDADTRGVDVVLLAKPDGCLYLVL